MKIRPCIECPFRALKIHELLFRERVKGSTYDIISVTILWALLNNPDMPLNYFKYNDNKIYDIHPTYKTILGISVSFYVLSKYY